MRWPKPVKVAVNVSPAQFKDEQLLGIIARALEDSGLPPERLEIEKLTALKGKRRRRWIR